MEPFIGRVLCSDADIGAVFDEIGQHLVRIADIERQGDFGGTWDLLSGVAPGVYEGRDLSGRAAVLQ